MYTDMDTRARVAIVADTHGKLDQRVANEVARCDYVVHAGDVGCMNVLRHLRPLRQRRVVVRGNNDVCSKWPDSEASVLEALPLHAELELPGGLVTVVHGDRCGPANHRHRWLRARYPESRVVVYGHSHRLEVDTSSRPWVLNPGAAGVSRTFGGPSLIIISASKERWRARALRFPLPGQAAFR